MEKRLMLLLKERAIIEQLRLLPEAAKKLILKQYDNEIDLIKKEVVKDEDVDA